MQFEVIAYRYKINISIEYRLIEIDSYLETLAPIYLVDCGSRVNFLLQFPAMVIGLCFDDLNFGYMSGE